MLRLATVGQAKLPSSCAIPGGVAELGLTVTKSGGLDVAVRERGGGARPLETTKRSEGQLADREFFVTQDLERFGELGQ